MIGARKSNTHLNEIDGDRANTLDTQGWSVVTREDAINYAPERKVDAIVTNPPFGKIGKIAGL